MPDSTPLARRTAAPVPPDRAQLEALLSYLEHDSAPMMVLDPAYQVLAANTAYQRQFAATGTSPVGRKCYEVSHHYDRPCDQAGEHCPMRQAHDSRRPDRVLHIHHTPRGPEHVDVELRPILDRQGRVQAYVERLHTLRSASPQVRAEGLVGQSAAFNQALAALQRVAPSHLPVLLLGESGTGKELFARALHEASDRARGPFVTVDCSGLTETLFESELFGYEKGAFTGATQRKKGLVETAAGGTLFLDEMGDVPLSMQVKLLRLIESGTFRRVGSVETQSADFRLVAATHKPLQTMVEQERFRQDLFYRINAFPIQLPPLRLRSDDIGLLVEAMLSRTADGPARHRLTPEALQCLQAYPWPGNIRELRNVVDRARLFSDDGVIGLAQLPEALREPRGPAVTEPDADGRQPADLEALARQFGGSRKALARRLGISERTLYRRLKGPTSAP